MAYERKDHFYKKAKREGKISRAVYKLEELQKRFQLIRKDDCVLDLGCAPGGWLQELSPLVGPSGKVIGIDLLPLKISPPPRCFVLLGNFEDESMRDEIIRLAGKRVDVICSDLSPNLSGVAYADAYRSYELALIAFEMCERVLKVGGHFLIKIFPGDEFKGYMVDMKKRFERVSLVTPEATRKSSSERYLVCLNFDRRKI